MKASQPGLVAVFLVAGLASSARAQFVVGGGLGASPGAFAGSGYTGVNGAFSTYGGFGNYGTTGINPGFGSGFGSGPGIPLGRNFAPIQPYTGPTTYNNIGGLMGTIARQTGRPGSYGTGSNFGVSRRRRGR